MGAPFLSQIVQALGGGGAAGPQGIATEETGSQVGAMSAELHGADPSFILRALQQCKQQLSQIFVQTSMRLPNIAGQVAKSMTQLDRAIKEAQQAAATQSVVRSPIGFSMAGPQPSGAGTPAAGLGG